MYLGSSALIFFADSDFSLSNTSMDVSGVVVSLSSSWVPLVTGHPHAGRLLACYYLTYSELLWVNTIQ